MRIQVHVFPPDTTWCVHCGTHKTAGQGMTCIWREVADPERPMRNGNAADDVDAIYARIKALEEERAAANAASES